MQILLAIDGSEASARVAEFVCACAHGRHGAVKPILVNVHRPPLLGGPAPELGADDAMTRAMHAQGEALLAHPQAALSQAGFTVRTMVCIGAPASTILDVARENVTAVIVMGTRGAGMLGGFTFGSVALRVAPAAPCPVILVKPEAKLPSAARQITRVIVPVDGSTVSDLAVERLLELRDLFGPLHIDLVHFEQALTLFESIMPPHDDVLRTWSGERSRQAVAATQRLLSGAGISHEVLHLAGEPAPGIVSLATERGADLIAMATHGTGALHHATFGSVALKVVILAGVPVMLSH